MSSRLRLAVIISPIVVGLIVTAYGLTEYYSATVIITPKTTAPYGILAFSSIFESKIVNLTISTSELDIKGNNVNFQTFDFRMTTLGGADSGEQIFGFQIPYQVELESFAGGGWYEDGNGMVEIEVVDTDVYMEEDFSIIYLKFIPLPGEPHYIFGCTFLWTGAIIKQTFSTYRLSIPVSTSPANVFLDYFSNLNYSVRPLQFLGSLRATITLPPNFELREAIPPIIGEVWYAERNQETGEVEFPPAQFLVWELIIEGKQVPPPPSDFSREYGEFNSEVVRIDFENLEELAKHNRLHFDSGLWVGIGVSNLIAGGYGILRYYSEKPRRMQK